MVSVERGNISTTVVNTRAGTVDACRRARLSPALGGQISRLPVSDGDYVEKGQLLLELWNADLRAEQTRAERDAVASRSRAREACVIADVAMREANRLTQIEAQGLASVEDTERAVGNAESRAAACDAAQDVTEVSEARVAVAEAALERTRLIAPFSGVIAEINGELGEFVTPSPMGIPVPPTVDLIDSTCLYISAPIDEVDAPSIKQGMPARISLDAFPNRVFAGHVRRVAPYVLDVEKQARTVKIEAEIDDPQKNGLLPGYSADVEILLASRDDILRIPTSVITDSNKVFVFDEDAGQLTLREIETGISNWEFTQVTAGLREGERIVSSIDREGVSDGAAAQSE
ncbi:MAG: efflux RND transporter periplasmic adaptor subunit [Gammaproteobacteria bacterium]